MSSGIDADQTLDACCTTCKRSLGSPVTRQTVASELPKPPEQPHSLRKTSLLTALLFAAVTAWLLAEYTGWLAFVGSPLRRGYTWMAHFPFLPHYDGVLVALFASAMLTALFAYDARGARRSLRPSERYRRLFPVCQTCGRPWSG